MNPFAAPVNLLLGILLVAGNSTAGDLPILYAENELVAPAHEIFGENGTSNYGGQLVVSEDFIAIYEAWDPGRESLAGRVRILDRVSLVERAVISLTDFQNDTGRGYQIAPAGDRLAVIEQAGEGTQAEWALYQLAGTGANLVLRQELKFEFGYALQMEARGEDFVLWDPEETVLFSGDDGAELGRWASSFGTQVGEHWFLGSSNENDGLKLVDFRESGTVRDLALLPRIETGFAGLSASDIGDKILLSSYYQNVDGTSRTSSSIYDPGTDLILWDQSSTDDQDPLIVAGEQAFSWLDQRRIRVQSLEDGKDKGTLILPEEVTSFGSGLRVVSHQGILYLSMSGDSRSLKFDEATLGFLGMIDPGDEPAGGALIRPIAGTEKLAWVYNDHRNSGFQINSYFWNPQVLVFDPTKGKFVGRIEPEDSLSRSSSGLDGYPKPENFGIEFYALPEGRIGMKSPTLRGDGNKYQIFDPILRVESPKAELTARLKYREKPGYAVTIEKRFGNGAGEVSASTGFGQGEERVVEVAGNGAERGERYYLKEIEKVRVATDYEKLIDVFPGAGIENPSSQVTLAPGAGAVVVSTLESGFLARGSVKILNHHDGSERFALAPRAKRFGSFVAVEGETVAIATAGLYPSDSITVFDLMTGEEKLSTSAASSFALSGDVMVRFHNGELIGHRISSDLELYRIPVDYTPVHPSDRPPLVCGAGVVILQLAVYDLETGAFRFDLVSPNPEPQDSFGAEIVADGTVIAAVSTGQATGYLFDAATGDFLRSFVVEELAEGFTNSSSGFPLLAMDAGTGVIAWAVNGWMQVPGINLFEISTGERFAQIRVPEPGFVDGVPVVDFTTIGTGLGLAKDGLWLVAGSLRATGLAMYDYSRIRNRPLDQRESEIIAQRYLKMSFRGRRGVNYQPFGGPLNSLEKVGNLVGGIGGVQSVLLPVPAGQNRWFGLLQPEWAPKPKLFPF